MTSKLIGLSGKARSGKDSAANYIQSWCEDQGFTTTRRGFADSLKESAAHSLGIFENEIEFCNKLKGDYERGSVEVRMATKGTGPNHVIAKVTGREFLQYYGTEAHRDVFGDNFWVDAILPLGSRDGVPDWWYKFGYNFGKHSSPMADICVITDVRFDNEAERIVELGGDIWKIEREGSGAGNHASEQDISMEYVDAVIDNNGTLDDLSGSVEVLMEIAMPQLESVINE